MMESPSAAELRALQVDAAMLGFKAQYRGQNLAGLCGRVLDIAYNALQSMRVLNDQGQDESIYLVPLFDRVQKQQTLAEEMLYSAAANAQRA